MREDDMGIWIDEREALIVYSGTKQVKLKRIPSGVETYHVTGGSRSVTPYGPQEVVSETAYLRRKNQQMKRYLQKVVEHAKSARRIYVVGPAQTKEELRKALVRSRDVIHEKLTVESADSMTKNQVKAKIRSHFEEHT